LMSLLDIARGDLPIIWDADFMLGPPDAGGNDSYVLCEINVSSVFPMPDHAPAEIARPGADRLLQPKRNSPSGAKVEIEASPSFKGRTIRQTNSAALVGLPVSYWAPRLAIFFSSSSFNASRLKLAPFCIGGNSSKVWAACAILSFTNTKRQNS